MNRIGTSGLAAIVVSLALALMLCTAVPVPADDGHTGSESHAEAAHDAEGGHHGGVTSEKLWDFVWRTMNFAVLFVLLFFLLRKPIGQALNGRRENIAKTLADLEKKKAEAEERFKELEGKIKDLDAQRQEILAEFASEGESEKERIIAHAHQMADRIKKQAEITIGHEIKAAKEELVKEIADRSATMAEELIRKNITDEDQERLVGEYLDKVVPN